MTIRTILTIRTLPPGGLSEIAAEGHRRGRLNLRGMDQRNEGQSVQGMMLSACQSSASHSYKGFRGVC